MEATAPVQARKAVGLGLHSCGQSQMEKPCRCKQTALTHPTGVLQNIIPVTPFHGFLIVYLFQGPTSWGVLLFFLSTEWFWQVLLFLTQTHVAVPRNGDFLHRRGRLHLVQKRFYLFSDSELPSDVH